ncbi:unnamed protein product [Leptosia nina]|uniref:Post-SET domain-containing protein n=1 Tax=Leptosia nina TaxID=320188 RepID=A0AAV1JTP1_9NEOP
MLEKNEVKGKPNIGDLDMLRGNKFEAGDSKEKPAKVGCPCMPMRNKTFEQKGDYKIENKGGPIVIKDNIKEGIKAYSKPREISKDGKCPYCKVCLKDGIGFSLFTKFNACVNKIKGWPTKFFKVKKPLLPIIPKAPKLKPLFNVYLEADSLNIINKEEVTEKVTQLHTRRGKGATKTGAMRKKHGKDCQCCYCLKGKKDAAAAKKAKEKADKVKEKEKNKKEKKKQTCVCGSVACARHVQFLKRYKPPEKKVIQPCSCGSPICDEEIAIMNAIAENPGGIMCLCQEEMKRRKKILEKKQKKEYEKRRKKISKQHSKADKIRRKKRLESAKVMEKSIKGDKNDVMLVAESVVDVAKLGITGITDVLRIMYRCAKDPKHSWRTVKSMAKDPSLIGKTLKETYNDSGVAATGRRVGMRLSAMGSVKETKNLLEQHPITNYILHIADKDPKKRLRKARKVKRKERIDFGCNLYMSSLRKRPFMFIFDRCPSFYPHCLSIVNVWKQFAEVVTFLLAVVVWSPCIFCMEICRAVMCCTLCTG